ncbi:hypothetical protein LZZ85_00215 [Terrimonas sp. NA20]|uniref:Uncharacterized protein n=1 Tax=Terrimonas ginsenosidimutans TaxID=2908004 RepID=A0ABS9KK16_9BACT|nr:hypothetical protein [Terrimonas ginsenosidimutans]MCG2612673.1 hypothetical protein [Terrimonas ginsenosidimutans]
MTKLKQISQKGDLAVRWLRQQKFKMGQPFMIYSKDLPMQFAYLEFASGLIQLAEIKTGSRNFSIVRDLSIAEANAICKKFKLSYS